MVGRYTGSSVENHGDVVSIEDCRCDVCWERDPWDPRARFSLVVRRDLDGKLVRLDHAHGESFTGSRSR